MADFCRFSISSPSRHYETGIFQAHNKVEDGPPLPWLGTEAVWPHERDAYLGVDNFNVDQQSRKFQVLAVAVLQGHRPITCRQVRTPNALDQKAEF